MEKTNQIRQNAAIAYLIISIISFFVKTHAQPLLWAIASTALGIAAGLYTTRDHSGQRDKEILHYFLYDGFVLFFGILVALTPAIPLSGAEPQTWGIKFYLPSLILGLTVGFLEDRLYELLPKKF